MAMLEGEANLTIDALNLATQAWCEQEYHRTRHSEIDATPLAHYLAGPNVARPCPASAVLAASFRIEVKRKQRRSDGTVSLNGARFEIPSRYRHFEHTHLQYARWDLSRVDLVDPRIPDGWVLHDLGRGFFRLEPGEFERDFWSRFHTCNAKAVETYAVATEKIRKFHGIENCAVSPAAENRPDPRS